MKNIQYLLFLTIVIFFFACDTSENEEDELETFNEVCTELTFNGLTISTDGDYLSLMDPSSPEFMNYLLCAQGCTGSDNFDCLMGCLSSAGIVPQGGTFTVVLYLTNNTGDDITTTINPGTWFSPSSLDYQPMLFITSKTITVEAGQTKQQILPVFCMDSGKSAPDSDSDYSICEIVTFDCMKEITNILKNKNLSTYSYEQSLIIQEAVWACSEGEPLDYEELRGLP